MLYDIIKNDKTIMQSIIDVFDRRDIGLRSCVQINDNEQYIVIAPSDYSDDEIGIAIVEEIDSFGCPLDSYLEYEYFDEEDVDQIRTILGE